ncbi:S9 family peptidase [Actinocatenispora rupis]|uniref:Oligopeptidase B n=1 Tax=Actinocatenispora rupis TaxID=519421 RepID=A0A8J3NEA3_9ACTN|nr:S9 family peptidase [Actinocatenispora rupis]GID13852.1 oligopeptidase B [Actinocatenispora rupis]
MTSERGEQPPVARRVPSERTQHGDTVVDEYAWLADKQAPETLAYLRAENAWTERVTAHLGDLREQIFTEIKDRTQETDLSVPTRKAGWWYYTRTVEGQQYPIHCRVKAGDDPTPPSVEPGVPVAGEDVLLDQNELADGHEFFALGTFTVSVDGRFLAYADDFAGDERFTLRVKDLASGELLDDEVPDTAYGAAWSADSTHLFYLTVDDAWRPYRVWRHRIGTKASDDVIVYEEPDERFWVGVGLTRSERYILIDLHSKVTSEVRYLPADDPTAEPTLIRARKQDVEYEVDHQIVHSGPDRFLVLHNDSSVGGGVNFALAAAPVDAPDEWTTVVPHADDTRLLDFDVFADHLVLSLRRNVLTGLRVYPLAVDGALGEGHDVAFPEPLYSVDPDLNAEYDTDTFRLSYTSLVTPRSVYDYLFATRELVLRKRTPVLGGYDPEQYEQFREWAVAPDGTRVPISVVARRDTPRDGTAPCLLYGYGSYEISVDPSFQVARLSLLDRGFVYAIAHVRGGGEMGRAWYDDGKMLRKKNTFTDFVACARHLVDAGWTSVPKLAAYGGSAGGLLMGAVVNEAPDAFGAIAAVVPFVDALNSILDPSLPLTVIEWDEWGDPLHNADVYAYMKSYSPYENVGDASTYPPIYVETSLNDTRVLYHEPAKWVARLRAAGAPHVTFKTEMEAGHAGPSGRYNTWRETARLYAWIVDTVG